MLKYIHTNHQNILILYYNLLDILIVILKSLIFYLKLFFLLQFLLIS